MDARHHLSKLAKRYELPSQIISLFAELHDVAPEVAQRLLGDLSVITAQPAEEERSGASSNFDRVGALFVETGNAPMTKAEIRERSGVSANTLHTLFYTTRKDAFEEVPDLKAGRAKAYRLTREALEEAKGQGEQQ